MIVWMLFMGKLFIFILIEIQFHRQLIIPKSWHMGYWFSIFILKANPMLFLIAYYYYFLFFKSATIYAIFMFRIIFYNPHQPPLYIYVNRFDFSSFFPIIIYARGNIFGPISNLSNFRINFMKTFEHEPFPLFTLHPFVFCFFFSCIVLFDF